MSFSYVPGASAPTHLGLISPPTLLRAVPGTWGARPARIFCCLSESLRAYFNLLNSGYPIVTASYMTYDVSLDEISEWARLPTRHGEAYNDSWVPFQQLANHQSPLTAWAGWLAVATCPGEGEDAQLSSEAGRGLGLGRSSERVEVAHSIPSRKRRR